MVGEEERVRRDLPGEVPGNVLLVNEDTHELGDSKRRVGLRTGSARRTLVCLGI